MQTIHCKRSIVYSYFFVGMILTASGCKKFLEPDYKTIVPTAVVFSNDDNAKAAISGLYGSLSSNQSSNGEITRALGMAADELRYFSSDRLYDQFSANHVLPDNDKVNMFWADFYNIIYQCNAIIENAVTSTGMSAAFKTQIIGEAKFLRAYSHFYLVNLFGPVPLITATAKEKTAYAPRSSEADVYAQIKADLTDAMNALPADYSVSGGKRVRANKWAAVALLARVYLYTREWAKAEAMATAVLANSSLYALQTTTNINQAFAISNTECILEWDRTNVGYTDEESVFSPYSGLAYYPMLPGLLNNFESSDVRKINWVKTIDSASTPYKYKQTGLSLSLSTSGTPGENYLVLRVAELYLIRAEARTQLNDLSGAQTDINIIRNRAGLVNDFITDKSNAMAAIEKERRTELFCEWAHRWFDLKRWPSLISPVTKTRADDVLGAMKITWKPTAILLPIPNTAMGANPNLTQNEGY